MPLNTNITLTPMGYNLTATELVCTGDGTCDYIYEGPRLCGKSDPVLPPYTDEYIGSCSDSSFFAVSKGTELYKAYTDSLTGAFERNYVDKCLQAYKYESFTFTHSVREYHYTLYYYDQAGNLLRTVPPAGVHKYDTVAVRQAIEAGIELPFAHTMHTDYRYNTLGEPVSQHTPDGGTSAFWYDRLGRLVVSQNAKQKDSTKYSYTKYDIIGRTTEVGQLTNSSVMADAISRDQGSLEIWLTNAASTAEQITQTNYDIAYAPIQDALKAKNLRNRVSWTALYDNATDLASFDFAAGTFYCYDIMDNVDSLLHYYKKGIMKDNGNGLKKIAYDFDLVSGKVNQVSYQPGMPDAFYHRYVYDAEDRITNVLTSADSINWDNDVFYQYYMHGPLARTVLGEQQVQGINHTYNLQGWIKSLNPDVYNGAGYTLKADGSNRSVVGKPAYQVMLNYYDGDYKAISAAPAMDGGIAGALGGDYRQLYDGNISSMAVNIGALNNPLLYNYQYDQLSRLVSMDAWQKTGNNWGSLTSRSDFQERVSYDPNGNILSYKRNGNTFAGKQLEMDDLTYNYITGTNRLDHVGDNVSATNYDDDIDEQPNSNYDYDAIGNLVKDSVEGITSISWTMYGKISRIVKNDGTTIIYNYDAGGNRISKTVEKTSPASVVTTWYVRDAAGKVVSVYEAGRSAINEGWLTQSELHLYGNGRVGLLRRSFDVAEEFHPDDTPMSLLGTGYSLVFNRGDKHFELTNHLENVLVAINDKKLGVSSNNNTVDYFEPQVVSAQDYYPFGMLQPGRVYNTSGYRYGFNGKENDNEVKGEGEQQDYGMRIYDPRLGRFLSVDPIGSEYPWNSSYAYAENDVIRSIDLDGLEKLAVSGAVPPSQYFKNDGTGHPAPGTTHYEPSHVNGFKAQADRLKSKYGFESHQVFSGQDLISSLKQTTKAHGYVSFLAVFAHAGLMTYPDNKEKVAGIFFSQDKGFYHTNLREGMQAPGFATVNEIKQGMTEGTIKFAPNALVFIDGCNATLPYAWGDLNTNLAYDIVMKTGVTVIAAAGHCEMVNDKSYDGRFKIADLDAKAGFEFWRLTRVEIMEEVEVPNHLQGSYGGDTPTVKVKVGTGKYEVKAEKIGTKAKVDDFIQKSP
jgi:RHS repeat-associated protein